MNNWNIEGNAPDTRYSALFEFCWMLFFGTVNILKANHCLIFISTDITIAKILKTLTSPFTIIRATSIQSLMNGVGHYLLLLLYANNYAEKSHRETIKILRIQTPEEFAVNTLKFEQNGFTVE